MLSKLSTFLGLFGRRNKNYYFTVKVTDYWLNLKGSLHITVCRSDFAKKTYPKHKNWPNVPLGRITFRRKD